MTGQICYSKSYEKSEFEFAFASVFTAYSHKENIIALIPSLMAKQHSKLSTVKEHFRPSQL